MAQHKIVIANGSNMPLPKSVTDAVALHNDGRYPTPPPGMRLYNYGAAGSKTAEDSAIAVGEALPSVAPDKKGVVMARRNSAPQLTMPMFKSKPMVVYICSEQVTPSLQQPPQSQSQRWWPPRTIESRRADMKAAEQRELRKLLAFEINRVYGQNLAVCCIIKHRELYPWADFRAGERLFDHSETVEEIMEEILIARQLASDQKLEQMPAVTKKDVEQAISGARQFLEPEVQWHGIHDAAWFQAQSRAEKVTLMVTPPHERALGECRCTMSKPSPLVKPRCKHWPTLIDLS
ncbi:hypothetical protein Micbo1qcDRAFT_177558 [Microdochium bolleyi]|uniref:Uncharacterized protein n=1 Tax=Microdochium bolleyi TaxID=196109 RepID=A0A136IW12_9PEZI|nr:hypothetical protein Micbo1qcDRAFT_177558 [Microdochium bolleyi]